MKRWVPVAAVALALAVAGCGGSDSSSTVPQGAAARQRSAAYLRKADEVCAAMLRRTKKLGHEFIEKATGSNPPTLLSLQTELLVKPGLAVLRDTARRLRGIAAEAEDPELSLYAGLYEPLIQLAELRLRAGREGDPAESQNLQRQMEEIGAEQRQVAAAAGLENCQADFLQALVSSWTSG
ncbi:MAG: hypothetical protein ACTHLH_11290 [Solirubrobacterales bacterium]